jgi:hypothetical protein
MREFESDRAPIVRPPAPRAQSRGCIPKLVRPTPRETHAMKIEPAKELFTEVGRTPASSEVPRGVR